METFKNMMNTLGGRILARLKSRWWFLLIIAGIIGFDQLSKLLVVKFLKPVHDLPIWEGVFHFTYLENRGAAFGMLADNRWVFMIVSVIGIGAFLFYLYTRPKNDIWMDLGLTFVIGGGIGNMIDRTLLGYVVDFINVELINFAIFNVADSFVTVGGFVIVFALVMQIIKEEKQKKQDKAEKDGSAQTDNGDVPPEEMP